MAGKITISTLNNDTGVLATQNGMTGIAKAWVNFNGTGTVAINGAFNVSSITDNGTGNYTINFTTAMANANYAVAGTVCSYDVAEPRMVTVVQGSLAGGATLKSTTQLQITVGSSSTGVYYDNPNVSYTVFGA